MLPAHITTDDQRLYLRCEICEDHPDPAIGFSFSWEHEVAERIAETIARIMNLHNVNHHEG